MGAAEGFILGTSVGRDVGDTVGCGDGREDG